MNLARPLKSRRSPARRTGDPVDFSASDFSASPPASSDEPGDWTYVDIDTFESNVGEFEADIEYEPSFQGQRALCVALAI